MNDLLNDIFILISVIFILFYKHTWELVHAYLTLTYFFVFFCTQICHLILLVGLYRTPVPWVAPALASAEAERAQKKNKAL